MITVTITIKKDLTIEHREYYSYSDMPDVLIPFTPAFEKCDPPPQKVVDIIAHDVVLKLPEPKENT